MLKLIEVCTLIIICSPTHSLCQPIEYRRGLTNEYGRPTSGVTVPTTPRGDGGWNSRSYVDPYRCRQEVRGCGDVEAHERAHARDLRRYGESSEESARRQTEGRYGREDEYMSRGGDRYRGDGYDRYEQYQNRRYDDRRYDSRRYDDRGYNNYERGYVGRGGERGGYSPYFPFPEE